MKRSVGPQKVLRGWLCVILVFALTPTHVTANEDVFQYQIMNGAADPFVTYHDGYYYMTFTQVDRIDIYKSASLADIANGEVTRAFTPPADGWGSQNIWAPKLHHIDGKWYLYYTADDGVDAICLDQARWLCNHSTSKVVFAALHVFKLHHATV